MPTVKKRIEVIGVDPGLSGGICWLGVEEGKDPYKGEFSHRLIQPPFYYDKERYAKPLLDFEEIRKFTDRISSDCWVLIEALELRGNNDRRGVATMFWNAALLHAAFHRDFEVDYISSQEWKEVMVPWIENSWVKDHEQAPSGHSDWKEASVSMVQETFPDVSLLPTSRHSVPNDGYSDAFLIALHAWHIRTGLSEFEPSWVYTRRKQTKAMKKAMKKRMESQ